LQSIPVYTPPSVTNTVSATVADNTVTTPNISGLSGAAGQSQIAGVSGSNTIFAPATTIAAPVAGGVVTTFNSVTESAGNNVTETSGTSVTESTGQSQTAVQNSNSTPVQGVILSSPSGSTTNGANGKQRYIKTSLSPRGGAGILHISPELVQQLNLDYMANE
jgi:hypothetical protein